MHTFRRVFLIGALVALAASLAGGSGVASGAASRDRDALSAAHAVARDRTGRRELRHHRHLRRSRRPGPHRLARRGSDEAPGAADRVRDADRGAGADGGGLARGSQPLARPAEPADPRRKRSPHRRRQGARRHRAQEGVHGRRGQRRRDRHRCRRPPSRRARGHEGRAVPGRRRRVRARADDVHAARHGRHVRPRHACLVDDRRARRRERRPLCGRCPGREDHELQDRRRRRPPDELGARRLRLDPRPPGEGDSRLLELVGLGRRHRLRARQPRPRGDEGALRRRHQGRLRRRQLRRARTRSTSTRSHPG